MRASGEDKQIGHSNWLQSLGESRNTCRKALAQASVDVSDPQRALWPPVSRGGMTQEHRTVAQCHAAVLDYAEHVEPFANRCSDPWTREIATFHFPDGDSLSISLEELEQWADRRYEIEEKTVDELTGTTTETEYRRVHLPTKYSRECFRALNECLENLELAADLPTPDYRVTGPEDAF